MQENMLTAEDQDTDQAVEEEAPEAAADAEVTDSAEEEGDAEPTIDLPLKSVVEALLFSARTPLKLPQLAKLAGRGIRRERIRDAVCELNREYLETHRAFEIVELAGKYQLMSRPEYAPHLQRLHGKKERDRKLTPASLDTLSVIAYKQPILRVDVEAIRGVGCGPVLRGLIERGLVKVVGRKRDTLGHPLLYGTTEDFLKEFGLASLDELPMVHELRRATGTEGSLPTGQEATQGQLALVSDSDEDPSSEEQEDYDDEDEEDDFDGEEEDEEDLDEDE